MIVVKVSKPEFEYDIHSLMKAFFPKENVSVSNEEKKFEEIVTMYWEITYAQENIHFLWKSYSYGDVPVDMFQDSHSRIKRRSLDEIFSLAKTEEIIKEKTIVVDFSDRTGTKNQLKQALYEMLSEYCNKKLPWGTLTGIRPTKIPMKLLEEGESEDAIRTHMKETYLASDEKINLSIDIAKRELEMLKKIDYKDGYSLYIGIPFCPTTCLYCSFTSYPLASWRDRMDAYLDALEKEIDFVAVKFAKKHLNSIYIGGGTPTTLEAYQLDRLIRKIKCSFDLSDCLEFTVEAGRPDSITREKLEVLYQHRITRISINPQTMKQETLKLIGRHHTVEQTIESFQMAREIGFDDINMDLIMGLPGENLEDVRHTMECIKELKPDNLTVHSLALKRAARLNMFKDQYQEYEIVNTQEHMELAEQYAKELGLEPYYLYRQKSMAGNLENVGYASKGKAGIYNVLIMEEKQTIMALGAGSTTKFVFEDEKQQGYRMERVENVKNVEEYLNRVDEMIERKIRKMEEISWH